MLDNKRKIPFIALLGAVALMTSAPAFAQEAAPAAPAAADAAAAAPAADAAAAPAAAAPADAAPAGDVAPATIEHAGQLTVMQMFMDAQPVVKVVMIGLVLASILSWTLLVTKLVEFASLNKASDRFVEAFRGAKSVNDMGRIAASEEFEGNPLADMAIAATQEVELSRQAGLAVSGWSLDAAMQGLHQVYFAQPAEQQQALLEGIVRAWAILAVMFVAFDMAVLDALAPPRLSPLDRAVDLHMRQWEGRYIAALLQSTFREETHERPGEDR